MDVKERILLGSIGGITPILVTVLVIDLKLVFATYDMFDWAGFLVRSSVLMFLGALIAYLHQKETERYKIFQLGMAAPALLAAAINGYSKPVSEPVMQKVVTERPVSLQMHRAPGFFMSSAFAADAEGELIESKVTPIDISIYKNSDFIRTESEIKPVDRFLRGLVGKQVSDTNNWFVIVGSHGDKEAAFKHVERLKKNDYIAKVYAPVENSTFFAVAIATHLSQKEAIKVREQAIKDGFPDDIYIAKR
ncbi:MAG: SPOR domain-containing protein [Thiohalomonadales bacterium]